MREEERRRGEKRKSGHEICTLEGVVAMAFEEARYKGGGHDTGAQGRANPKPQSIKAKSSYFPWIGSN